MTMAKITNLRGQMVAMPKGREIVVSVDDYSPSTVHNYVSELGFRYRRTYTAKSDRSERTITVRRID